MTTEALIGRRTPPRFVMAADVQSVQPRHSMLTHFLTVAGIGVCMRVCMHACVPRWTHTLPHTHMSPHAIYVCSLTPPITVLPNFAVVAEWAVLVCQEFSDQVAREKQQKIEVSAFMDGLDTPEAIAKLQCNFIDYVVAPLWSSIGAFT